MRRLRLIPSKGEHSFVFVSGLSLSASTSAAAASAAATSAAAVVAACAAAAAAEAPSGYAAPFAAYFYISCCV